MSFVEQIDRRTAILYVRVRPVAKTWVEKTAARMKVSESILIDEMISSIMRKEKTSASRKKARL